jgi:hypothetical protein
MSMRVCTFKIFMEHRAVICFLTLKGLRPTAIASELQPVYKTGPLALSTVKKWRKGFAEGRTRTRTSFSDDPRCGRPLTITNGLAEAICSMLKERPWFHARFSDGTSALQRGLACEFFMIRSA